MEHALQANEIAQEECCVCFGTYQEDMDDGLGSEWVQCSCSHWLHEDCAIIRPEDIVEIEVFALFVCNVLLATCIKANNSS